MTLAETRYYANINSLAQTALRIAAALERIARVMQEVRDEEAKEADNA